MQLTEQLMLADCLHSRKSEMLEPHELPGRYGRVIADLERLLIATSTSAVVAGGWAVWRHGYVGRVTQDVDIVVPCAAIEDLLRTAPLCGFTVLHAPDGHWPKLEHRDTGIEVDFLPEAAFPGTAARKAPVAIRHPDMYGAESGRLTYATLESLFELKLGAHRAKDLADLVELIKVNEQQMPRVTQAINKIDGGYAAELAQLIRQAQDES